MTRIAFRWKRERPPSRRTSSTSRAAGLRRWLSSSSGRFSTVERKPRRESTSARPAHVTLAVVLQVRDGRLQALLWQRAREPFLGAWSLPGGYLEPGETLEQSIRGHLAQQGRRPRARPPRAARDAQRSRPQPARVGARDRLPRARPAPASTRRVPEDTRWHPVSTPARARLRPPRDRARRARAAAGEALVHEHRLRARAAGVHASPSCATLYVAALGHEVSATNLQRVLLRRGVLEATGERREPRAAAGGRPAALYRFRSRRLEITDQFAVLRPPG